MPPASHHGGAAAAPFSKKPPTPAECEAWIRDPSTNPRTNRSIKAHGPAYRSLREASLKNDLVPPVHTLPQCLEDLEFTMRELNKRMGGGRGSSVRRAPRPSHR
jgi:hypothetical protein